MVPIPSSRSRSKLRGRTTMPIDQPAARDTGHRAWPTNQSEFASLVEDYADRLVRYAFRQVGHVQDAEDIVQDVFAKVFAIDRHGQVVSVGPYLYRSVGNACTDLLRCRTRSAVVGEDVRFEQFSTAGAGPLEAAQAAEDRDRAEAILARLPPEQAEVIRLRVFDGLRLDEIADVLDCSINTVSSRLRYGFQKLRDAVGQKGTGYELS
jgi:RNA polymerase sigma-70 factor (ECF subfamily)